MNESKALMKEAEMELRDGESLSEMRKLSS